MTYHIILFCFTSGSSILCLFLIRHYPPPLLCLVLMWLPWLEWFRSKQENSLKVLYPRSTLIRQNEGFVRGKEDGLILLNTINMAYRNEAKKTPDKVTILL